MKRYMHETIPFRSVLRISTIEFCETAWIFVLLLCKQDCLCVSSVDVLYQYSLLASTKKPPSDGNATLKKSLKSAETLGALQGFAGCNQANLTVMGGGSLSCTPLCFSVGLYDLYKRSLLIEELGLWDANNDNRHTQNLFERMGRMEAEL